MKKLIMKTLMISLFLSLNLVLKAQIQVKESVVRDTTECVAVYLDWRAGRVLEVFGKLVVDHITAIRDGEISSESNRKVAFLPRFGYQRFPKQPDKYEYFILRREDE